MTTPPRTPAGVGTVWEQLARRLRRAAQQEARRVSPPMERFKVTGTNPLVMHSMARDFALEEGDPDVEIADTVDQSKPQVGELVVVHRTENGIYVVGHVVRRGGDQ